MNSIRIISGCCKTNNEHEKRQSAMKITATENDTSSLFNDGFSFVLITKVDTFVEPCNM